MALETELGGTARDPILESMEAEDKAASMRFAVDTALQGNPDVAAKRQTLAKQVGVAPIDIEGREEEFARNQRLREYTNPELVQQYPVLADSLRKPEFAQVSVDDIDNLKATEGASPMLLDGPSSVIGGIGGQADALGVRYPAVLGVFYNVGDRSEMLKQYAASAKRQAMLSQRQPQYMRDFQNADGFFGTMAEAATNPRAVIRSGAEQLPQIIPSVAGMTAGAEIGAAGGGAVGGPAGAGVGGVVGGVVGGFVAGAPIELAAWIDQRIMQSGIDFSTLSEEEIAQKIDALTRDEKFVAEVKAEATRKAVVTAGIDAVTGPFMSRYMNAAKATGASGRKLIAPAAKDIGINTGLEGVGEGAGQLAATGDVSGSDVAQEMLAGAPGSAIETGAAFVEANRSGRIKTPAPTRDKLEEVAKQSAENKKKQIADALDLARTSKVAQRSPVAYRDFVKQSTGDSEIFVEPEAAVTFYQTLPPGSKEQVENVMPGFGKRIEESIATGNDVTINKADYMAFIAPLQEADHLTDHIRFSADDYSIAQLQNVDDLVAQFEEDSGYSIDEDGGIEPEEQLARRLESEFANAGMTPDAARLDANLARNAFTAFGDYTNSDEGSKFIQDAFGRLTIRAPQSGPKMTNVDRGYVKGMRDYFRSEARKKKLRSAGSKVTDMFGSRDAKKREKATPKPVVAWLMSKGGIQRNSPIAKELTAIGLTPEKYPGLYTATENGLRDIDNIPANEFNAQFQDVAGVAREDGNGYVDRNFMLETLRDEDFGKGGMTQEQRDKAQRADQYAQVRDYLDQNKGIDVMTAAEEDIMAALRDFGEVTDAPDRELFQTAPAVETNAFKKWFGDSKVVDANGKPLVVYHGTDKSFTKFDRKKTTQGIFWVTSDKSAIEAGDVGAQGKGKILELYASIQNPAGWAEYDKFGLDELRGRGFDGAILPDPDGTITAFVFEPTQLKSVQNKGSYDAKDARILYQTMKQADIGERASGSIAYLPDGRTVINLFQNANLSTALHEMGHFYWGMLHELNAKGLANERGQRDWATMREFVGAEEGAALTVDQEEKIARAFEAYLREGKAPSMELQRSFQRFKAWLLRIYKDLRDLDITINDEVRGVFDRMLATDDAIDAMKDNQLFRPDPAVLEMLNKQQQENYVRQAEKAVETTKERLLRKALRQAERKNTGIYKAEREKIEREVTERVSGAAVYKALDAMQKGELFDGTKFEVKPRLDRRMVKELMGEDTVNAMPRATMTSNGLDPEIVADMFGFSSARSMIEAMVNAPSKKERIAQQVEDTMVGQFGDMMQDGSIEREAMEDFHNADRAAQVHIEYSFMADKAGIQAATQKEFAAAAARILGEKHIDGVTKPGRFLSAEVRAARDAGKYLAKKDYAKAADAKRRQMLNHHLYKQSMDATREIDSALRKFKKLMKPVAKNKPVKIDEDYHLRIVALLNAYNLGSRMSDARRTKLEMATLAQWAQAAEAMDEAQLEIPAELLESDKTHYRDMSMDEFRALRDTVFNIETQGRKKREYLINGKKRELDALVGEAIEKMAESLPVREFDDNPSKLAEFGSKYGVGLVKAREFIRQLDGGKLYGIVHDAMIARIDDGMNRYTTRKKEAGDKFHELLDANYDAKELARIGREKLEVAGIGTKTKEQILLMALNWGNDGNREALLAGEKGWTNEAVLAAFDKHMTAKDWDFVEGVWSWFNGYWPEISALEKRRKGYTPKKVDVSAAVVGFVDADGNPATRKIEGGYFPIMGDPRRSPKARENSVDDWARGAQAGYASAQTRRNHTNARVGAGREKRPLLLQFSVIPRHVDMVLRDLELGEATHDASRFLRRTEIREAISERLGTDAYAMLDLWVKDVAVGNLPSLDPIAGALDRFRANASIAYMGFSISTFVQQFTGLTNTAAALGQGGRGWKYVGKGILALKRGYTSDGEMRLSDIYDASEFMANRKTTMTRDMSDAIRSFEGDIGSRLGLPSGWQKLFLAHIQKAQSIIDAISWLGALEKARSAEGLDEAASIRYADNIVRAQASGLTQDMAGIERGSLDEQRRFNPYVKLFTFMYSYYNTKLNLAYGKVADARAERISIADATIDIISLIWLDALMSGIVMQSLPGGDDDDDKEGLAWAKWGIIQPMNALPLVRDASSALEGFNPTGGPFGDFIKSFGSVVTQAEQGDLDTAFAKSIVTFSGLAIGLPSTQINRLINAADRAAEGKDVGYIDFVRSRKPGEK